MMDNSKNRKNDYLGVNKIGKNIKTNPLHLPNFVTDNANSNSNSPARQQPQAQVYNINKSDFRTIVQQLTGLPSRQDPLPRQNTNPPLKHPSMRLQRFRPPPLTPINRGQMPPVVPAQAPMQMQPRPQGLHMVPPQGSYNNRALTQFDQPSPRGMQPFARGDGGLGVPALSPVSAYMQQLQSCIGDGSPRPNGPNHMEQNPQMPGQFQGQPRMQSHDLRHYQPQLQGPQPPMLMQPQTQHPVNPQGPRNVQAQSPGSGLLPNPNMPPLPSPGSNGIGLLPSPTSQFSLPSPSFFNFSPTPRSPYPLLSPGSQFPPPLSPNFAFPPLGQSGVLGAGPALPLSPRYAFPLSPSGLLPISSPRWRDPSF